MNHNFIADYDIIGRYRRGTLTPEAMKQFEEHLRDCLECRALVDADVRLECGLRTIDDVMVTDLRIVPSIHLSPMHLAIAAVAVIFAIAAMLHWQPRQADMPHTTPPVFMLAVTRGATTESTEIHVPNDEQWYVLELETPIVENCCRVVIEDAHGGVVWRSSTWLPESGGFIRVTLSRDNLRNGAYRVALLTRAGNEDLLFEYQIELTSED